MYGYIRPNRGELRVKDYERYNAVYCGLCHALSRRCGLLSRFTVSYDLTFLALLLPRQGAASCARRCIRHPFRARRCLCGSPALDAAADCGMILDWWKLRDAVKDERGWKSLAARVSLLFLRRGYRRAKARQPDFDALVQQQLEKLAKLEEARCATLDAPADCFARLLSACAAAAEDEERRRILSELLYHVGRSIYLLDAADDLDEDRGAGRYNPLLCRFPDWDEQAKELLRGTLNLSQHRAAAAFELLPANEYSDIAENIITVGLPQVTELVLSGQWKERGKLRKEYSRRTWREKV